MLAFKNVQRVFYYLSTKNNYYLHFFKKVISSFILQQTNSAGVARVQRHSNENLIKKVRENEK